MTESDTDREQVMLVSLGTVEQTNKQSITRLHLPVKYLAH